MWELFSQWQELSEWYPICWGSIGLKWFGLRPCYNNTHLASQLPQPWPPPAEMAPSAPHEALRSSPMRWMDGWQPPEQADIILGGGWGGGLYGPQSAPLFRQWCIATTLECFEGHTHPQHAPKYICLLRRLLHIHSTHWHVAQGLMWGARGPSPLAAAMVGYGCVGHCWLLEANIRSTYCRNSKNGHLKYFYSYVDSIHSDIWPSS